MIKTYKKTASVKDYAFFLSLSAMAAAVIIYPYSVKSFTDGVKLWYACILPSLFPYAFITTLMSNNRAAEDFAVKLSPLSEKIFNVNGSVFYAFILSVTAGYPIGAKCVSDLYLKGLTGKSETVRAAALCSTSSPVFTIVSIGSIAFNNVFFGVMLFTVHFISAVIIGVIFSFYRRKEKPEKPRVIPRDKIPNPLYDSAEKSAINVLAVGGIIAIFYLFTDMLFSTGILNPVIQFLSRISGDGNVGKGIVFSVFECTKGLKTVASSGIKGLTLPLCAAICGFGGLSVIAQSMAFLKSAKIKTATFVLIKLLAAAINFIVGFILSFPFFF